MFHQPRQLCQIKNSFRIRWDGANRRQSAIYNDKRSKTNRDLPVLLARSLINQLSTHTRETSVMVASTICSAYTIMPSPINASSNHKQTVSCVGGPQQKTLWCVAGATATIWMHGWDNIGLILAMFLRWKNAVLVILLKCWSKESIGSNKTPRFLTQELWEIVESLKNSVLLISSVFLVLSCKSFWDIDLLIAVKQDSIWMWEESCDPIGKQRHLVVFQVCDMNVAHRIYNVSPAPTTLPNKK